MTSQSAKAARSRNGGHERRRGGGAHAAERDRVLDVQQVTDCRSDHEFLHYESLPRVCCPAGLLVRADEVLAHKIIELAKAGERDPDRLCDDVLKEFRAPPHV